MKCKIEDPILNIYREDKAQQKIEWTKFKPQRKTKLPHQHYNMQRFFFFNITNHIEHILTYLRTQNCKHDKDLFFTLPAVKMLPWKSITAIENREKTSSSQSPKIQRKGTIPRFKKKNTHFPKAQFFSRKNYKNRRKSRQDSKCRTVTSKKNKGGKRVKLTKWKETQNKEDEKERVLRQQW